MTTPDPLAIAAQIEQEQPVVAAMLRRLARCETALEEAAEHFESIYKKALHWQRVLAGNEFAEERWSGIKRHAYLRAKLARAALAELDGEEK